MGFNDDLVSRSGPTFGVCVGATGAAPNRKLVATWQQAAFFDVAGPPFNGTITFSIVLSETTNTIDVVFQTLAGPGNALGETAATGVQSGASPATSFNCSEGFMTSSTRVRFIP